MSKLSSKLKIYLYSALVIIGLAVLLGTLSYLFSFDADIGYLNHKRTPLPSVLVSLCVIGAVWFLSPLFWIPKGELDGTAPTTLTVSIAALPLCLCSLALGVMLLLSHTSFSGQTFIGSFFLPYSPANTRLLAAGGVLLILTAVYFGLLWTKGGDVTTLFGFSVPLTCIIIIALTYFDLFVAMNSPIKLSLQLSLLAFMVFMLQELRVSLGKPTPRLYLSLSMISSLLLGVSSIPTIVAYCAGKLTNLTYMLYAVFALCAFIYTLARLILFVNARCLLEKLSDQTYGEEELTPPEENNI